jgi:hypothetical protein
MECLDVSHIVLDRDFSFPEIDGLLQVESELR